MYQKGSFLRWLFGALLVIAVLAGVGYAGYHFGYIQGMANAPEIATAISKAAENGQTLPVPPMLGYGRSYASPFMWMPHHGFFPFGGLLGFLFLIFLFFGLMRLIFRPHWYPAGPGMHGHWRGYPPPWAQECKEGQTDKQDSPAENK